MLSKLVLIGIVGGFFGGFFGIGGGIIIIPALVYIFGFTQQQAQGTTLAMMLPPIGLLAVLEYHRHGNVDFRVAIILCLGFLIGSYFGARVITVLPSEETLKRLFAIYILAIGLKMLIKP